MRGITATLHTAKSTGAPPLCLYFYISPLVEHGVANRS